MTTILIIRRRTSLVPPVRGYVNVSGSGASNGVTERLILWPACAATVGYDLCSAPLNVTRISLLSLRVSVHVPERVCESSRTIADTCRLELTSVRVRASNYSRQSVGAAPRNYCADNQSASTAGGRGGGYVHNHWASAFDGSSFCYNCRLPPRTAIYTTADSLSSDAPRTHPVLSRCPNVTRTFRGH